MRWAGSAGLTLDETVYRTTTTNRGPRGDQPRLAAGRSGRNTPGDQGKQPAPRAGAVVTGRLACGSCVDGPAGRAAFGPGIVAEPAGSRDDCHGICAAGADAGGSTIAPGAGAGGGTTASCHRAAA